ncbi:response regulator [Azohydromonas aeria]|uniref:response regulator n=1 Tax=Azohydromonas aeria TaxID=2590212 RepID=UPI0012F8D16F|nr:response regulator [Azohydromonas aeria]
MDIKLTRVLVVDDEPELRGLLQRYLQGQGLQVHVLPDTGGLEALLASAHFDVLVLDVMLPGEDGFAACRRLRAAGHRIPIVMLTARGDPGDRILGLDTGADDYLCKPFSPRELLARIQAQLRRQALLGSHPRPRAAGEPA